MDIVIPIVFSDYLIGIETPVVKELTKIAGINNPWMIDPRPNSYIGEFRDDFADLDYGKGVLKIEGLGTF